MQIKQVIKEIKETENNGDTMVKKGVYFTDENEYHWVTATRSGYCKTLATAMRKAGFW